MQGTWIKLERVKGRAPRFNPTPLLLSVSLLSTQFPLGSATAQETVRVEGPLVLHSFQGKVEVQESDLTWRPLTASAGRVERALRTGTGRAVLTNGMGGRSVVGSASRLRQYSGKPDFQAGQFLLEGPVAAFARGSHLVMTGKGKARIDLTADGSTQRVAVIEGQLRVSNGPRLLTLSAGQQLALHSFQQQAFVEDDPWYASVFTGSGAATLEALRGTVRWISAKGTGQEARVGQSLAESQSLSTAENSWAEVGFTGGGYLRLSEHSELKVLAVEKTTRGREVTLQLLKGSAWNVVEKGQGGYKISTPVVSTAVRGTKFRVDASGLVKVVEGTVALPSEGQTTLTAGQQKAPRQPVQALQKDDLDLFNEALDAEQARPLQLNWTAFARHQQQPGFALGGSPDTVVSATLQGKGGPAVSVPVTSDMAGGAYRLAPNALPDGRYTLDVKASRFGQGLRWSRVIWIDQTAPVLSDLKRQVTGRVVTLSGLARDVNGRPLTLRIKGPGGEVTRSVQANAPFRLLLPPGLGREPLELTLTDAAGNGAHAELH